MRWVLIMFFLSASAFAQDYDLVIANGRVIDPESWLDGVRNIGINGGTIRAVTEKPLRGKTTIDARGLIVSSGFIDLHSHGADAENYRLKALDGVTTAMEMEVGTGDIDRWYGEREGKTLIHYGASIGHIPVRINVMHDPSTFLPSGDAAHKPATEAQIKEMAAQIEHGLKRGAPAVGFGFAYTLAASRWEILEMFRVAAQYNASCHVHLRYAGDHEPGSSIEALEEAIAAAEITGAPLHVVHIQSTGLRATPRLLQMISDAKYHGLDVTTECYPYNAGMTALESAIFDEGWQQKLGITYKDIMWVDTGERLTAESFARYRKQGGMVILFTTPEDAIRAAVASPVAMIASDGMLNNGKGHPRSSGTYSRILGRYVREYGTITWMDALRKMSLMPAQRLERRVPAMKNKGRIRVGADADITIFDPDKVIDKSTYQSPATPPEGIRYVFVNGVLIAKDGQVQPGVLPGQPIRAPLTQ